MIITITLNPSIDRTVTVKNTALGDVNKIMSSRVDAGGGGIYTSRVLDVLDVENVAIGIAGRDNYRDFAALLLKTGIDNDFIMRDGATRTNVRINDRATGAYTRFDEAGLTLRDEDMDAFDALIKERIKYNDVVVISGNPGGRTKAKLMETLVKDCKAQGAYVIADASGNALQSACNGIPYMITPNLGELSALTKEKLGSVSDIVRASREIVSAGITAVVTTMGAEGLVYVSRREALYAPALKVKSVCHVGAGDAVNAAMAFTKQWGMGSEAAVQLAVSAGAAAVQTEGCDPPLEQVVRDNAGLVKVQRVS